jgi:hypothetical protein
MGTMTLLMWRAMRHDKGRRKRTNPPDEPKASPADEPGRVRE